MASYQAWYQCHKIRRMMLTIMLCYMVATFIALTDGNVEPSILPSAWWSFQLQCLAHFIIIF
jgi:hypothetical protein